MFRGHVVVLKDTILGKVVEKILNEEFYVSAIFTFKVTTLGGYARQDANMYQILVDKDDWDKLMSKFLTQGVYEITELCDEKDKWAIQSIIDADSVLDGFMKGGTVQLG